MLRALLPAPAVPQARRGGLSSARPAGARVRLPPADAVSRHGRRPVDLRRAERDRRPLSQGARRLSRRTCSRSCWNRPSTITGCRIDEDYEQVLDPVPGRADAVARRAMSFLQPMLLAALAAGRAADHHPPDQPAPVSDDPLGGDDVPAGGQPDVARATPGCGSG